MNINYKSDFKVTITPTVGGTPVDITGHDFRLVFTTTGGTRRFTASQKDGVCENCYIEGTAIVVTLDNHCLPTGQLWVSVYDYAPDVTYPDGNELTVTPQQLDVTLVSGAGDGSAVDAQVSVDIGEAVSAAREAADAAGASADIARAAQEAAEAAAERAEQVDGYTKAEANALLALKADKATTYTKGEVKALIPAPEVFEAQYGVTTYEEVVDAYNAGKVVIVKYFYRSRDHVFVLQGFSNGVNVGEAEFFAIRSSASYRVALSTQSIWSSTYTGLEQNGLKVTSISSSSSDNQYPSAKCVYDELQGKADKVPVVDVSGTEVTQELAPNTFYRFGTVDALTLTLATAPSGTLAIYACSFTAASDSTTLTLPATVIGEAPTIAAGHRYELNIMDGILLYNETNGND